jgi:hypothetical protein
MHIQISIQRGQDVDSKLVQFPDDAKPEERKVAFKRAKDWLDEQEEVG